MITNKCWQSDTSCGERSFCQCSVIKPLQFLHCTIILIEVQLLCSEQWHKYLNQWRREWIMYTLVGHAWNTQNKSVTPETEMISGDQYIGWMKWFGNYWWLWSHCRLLLGWLSLRCVVVFPFGHFISWSNWTNLIYTSAQWFTI